MKTTELFIVKSLATAALFASALTGTAVAKGSAKLNAAVAQQSLAFVENKGQWDANAAFVLRAPGMDYWVTSQGMVLDFHKVTTANGRSTVAGDVVRMTFMGSKPTSFVGSNPVPGVFNYLAGSDRSHWALGAMRYSEVTAEQLYRGVEVRYSLESGMPRYDLVLKPGADLSQVAIRVQGAQALRIETNGDLTIQTSVGTVVQKGLAAYQKVGGAYVQVPCHVKLSGETLTFDSPDFDTTNGLVIDPILYSTFVGPNSQENLANGVAEDKSSNLLVAGNNTDGGLPTTTGAYQTKAPATVSAFLMKFNPTMSALSFCTYFGGTSGTTSANAIALDSAGEPVIFGNTTSSSLPVSSAAYLKTNPLGSQKTFVAKLNSTGTALVFSTYLGGDYFDNSVGVQLDAAGNPVVMGYTESADFPTTKGAFQTTLKGVGEAGSVFVTKLNTTGSALIFSTLIGGSGTYNTELGWEGEVPNQLILDSAGEPIVVGKTFSSDYPTSSTAFQKVNNEYPNSATGFVTKLNATGTALVFSTFLGGTGASGGGGNDNLYRWGGDAVEGVALTSSGLPIVVGGTASTNFPVTSGAFQTTNKANAIGGANGFVAELNSTGSGLVFSTLFGGSRTDGFFCVGLDSSQNIIACGEAASVDFPITAGAFQTHLNGLANMTLVKFNPTCTSLLYSSYIGGNGSDTPAQITITPGGAALITGSTTSADFPTTAGSVAPLYQSVITSIYDTGFLSMFSFPAATLALDNFEIEPPTVVGGNGVEGRVYINNSTSAPTTISLVGAGPITVPATIVIPAGGTTANFPILTKGVTALSDATVTATYASKSIKLTLPVSPAVMTLIVSSTFETISGATITGLIQLNGEAGPTGTTVTLKVLGGPATIPASVPVSAGKTWATFPIKVGTTTTSESVTIQATQGTTVLKLIFTVNP
jgi:hypothetical protein